MSMRLYRTQLGVLIEYQNRFYEVTGVYWDRIVQQEGLSGFLRQFVDPGGQLPEGFSLRDSDYLPPIVSQEVWAAGVTYRRSKAARMEESEEAGGAGFYDQVYTAERPELFPKAVSYRVVGHRQTVRVRSDSSWTVPEPELTLLVSPGGKLLGYTVGNDVSSRDIEGENPLYLPQAKVYDRSCSIGPGVLVADRELPEETSISIEVQRTGESIYRDNTFLSEMKRSCQELIEYLTRECSFPYGCYLMTGTGIVPPSNFSLCSGDLIRITISGVGTLINTVE
jgi:2-dehydro-3-deoxy-D-arabinonate dehydratase